ncbi:MAG: carboxylesterase family protein [Coriobacteriales bacterium]|jgi:para-nitrobenzyl esterase
MAENPIATCAQGKLEGVWRRDAMVFRGVPYASLERRLALAGPAPSWEGTLDATGVGPAFPQFPGPYKARLDGQKVVLEQREDAFTLSICTPDTQGKRPVVLWIHGGGYTTGSASAPEYEGALLASRGDIVFVGANYRLGALGNLHLPGVARDNLPLHDLIAALSWVRDNIADFGGDPEQITIAAQSAGAWFALALAGLPELRGCFKKLALLSAPGDGPIELDMADELAASLIAELGLDDPAEVLDVPCERVIEAQWAVARKSERVGISFMPCVEEGLLPRDLIGRAIEVSGADVPLFDGITSDECSFFISRMRDMILGMDEAGLTAMADGFTNGAGREALERFSFINDPYERMVRIFSNRLFHEPGARLAAGFDTSFAYRMDYKSKAPHLGSSHCIDLPFLFGDFEQWAYDPAMRGESEENVADLMRSFSSAFISFVRTGDPRCAEMPEWPAYESEDDRVVLA